MSITEPTTRPDLEPTTADDLEVLDLIEIHHEKDPASGHGGPPPATTRWSPRHASRSAWITAAIGLLAFVTYTWNLAANGYANDYYTAAVKAMSVDWKAFFFGSIDPGNFITVDKPPGALWVQALSARIFGFSSWSMLLPEALAGVASVLILHRLVRRWAGDTAAHLAALAFALTPVAVLMFRFNNPDAFLTFLGLAATWALWKALEDGRTRHLVLSAALVGLAFNTKMMQAFLILPAFILVYLVAGPPRLRRRLLQLTAALGTLIVSAGWWVLAVSLWPAADRPYIGSTSDNSVVSLLLGYNGLARILGNTADAGPSGGGAAGGPGGGTGFGGAVSWLRMFNDANGGQIAWFIPMALLGLAAGLWLTRREPRTSLARAGWLLWGGYGVGCLVVFSRAQGIFHPYYSIQVAPALAALAGAGSIALWRLGRTNAWMRGALPAAVVLSAAVSVMILDRTPDYLPWLRPVVIGGAAIGATGLWLGTQLRHRLVVTLSAVVVALALFAGPTAYSITTVQSSASGSIVAAGPSVSSADPMAGGGMGGSSSSTADTALISYLEANRGDATYLVAAFGSHSSASIIIATGDAVMTIGGFSGSDPAPTLDQFKDLVASGEVRYVLVSSGGMGGGMGGPGGSDGTSSSISTWATTVGTAVNYGSTSSGTLYDLSAARA